MIENYNKNFTSGYDECLQEFNIDLDNVFKFCRTNFTEEGCLMQISIVKKSGEECFHREERFDDKNDWLDAGIVVV